MGFDIRRQVTHWVRTRLIFYFVGLKEWLLIGKNLESALLRLSRFDSQTHEWSVLALVKEGWQFEWLNECFPYFRDLVRSFVLIVLKSDR
jgi:hypothetical protein